MNIAIETQDTLLREYSVTEFSTLLKKTIESNFGKVKIRGEISGLKIAPSGHIYFSLKDEQAVISGICWKTTASKSEIKLEEGLQVICIGYITTYPMHSKYQLIVEHFEISGSGELMALLLARKDQLAKEGLFDQSRKMKLPFLPETIGVITSPTGAVIRDILHRLSDRMPVRVILWPVLVQGEKCANQVSEAIDGFNKLNIKIDLLIVARGGGSIEDLFAFNEEIVVRSAANSKIPIISAIGHETDFTLLDFVADLRAPTPTAAAEMSVPVRSQLISSLEDKMTRATNYMLQFLHFKNSYLKSLSKLLDNSVNFLMLLTQKLDHSIMRFNLSIENNLNKKRHVLNLVSIKINTPEQLLQKCQEKLNYFVDFLFYEITNIMNNFHNKLTYSSSLLESYNYKNVLARGYSIIRSEDGKILDEVKKLHQNTIYNLEMRMESLKSLGSKFYPKKLKNWINSNPKIKQILWFVILWFFGLFSVLFLTYPIKILSNFLK